MGTLPSPPTGESTRWPPRARTEVVQGLDRFRALVPELEALTRRRSSPVTTHPAWVAPALPAADDWSAVLLQDPDGRLQAAAVLLQQRDGNAVTVTLAGTDGGHRGAVLADAPDAAEALGQGVGRALQARARHGQVALGPLPAGDPLVDAFVRGLPGAVVLSADPVPVLRRQDAPDVAAYLTAGTRRSLRRAGIRLAQDKRQTSITLTSDEAPILEMLPVLERCHRGRDHAHGRASALDDPSRRALWESRIRALVKADTRLELAVLTIDGLFAAYVLGVVSGSSYQVLEGRFLTGWAKYSPGRLLEAAVIQRMLDDPTLQTVDWMTAVAPETLLAANDLDPMVIVRLSTAAA